MHIAGRLSPEEMDNHVRALQQKVRETAPELPLYGLTAWSGWRAIGEWAFEGGPHALNYGSSPTGQPTQLPGSPALDKSSVQVHTTMGHPRQAVSHLRVNVEINLPGAVVDFENMPSYLDTVPDRLVEISVEATPVLFEVWDSDGHSYAGGVYLDHPLAIHTHRASLEDLSLATVTDLEPYLAGQLDWITRARAEADAIEFPDAPQPGEARE